MTIYIYFELNLSVNDKNYICLKIQKLKLLENEEILLCAIFG